MYDEFHVLHQLLPEKINRTHNLRCGLNIRPKYTVSQKKQNYFCYNYVKLPPNLTIFGTINHEILSKQ